MIETSHFLRQKSLTPQLNFLYKLYRNSNIHNQILILLASPRKEELSKTSGRERLPSNLSVITEESVCYSTGVLGHTTLSPARETVSSSTQKQSVR